MRACGCFLPTRSSSLCTHERTRDQRRRDARDDLRKDDEPHVDVDRVEAIEQRLLHERLAAVAEPEREQTEQILDRIGRAERNGAEEALQRADDVAEHPQLRCIAAARLATGCSMPLLLLLRARPGVEALASAASLRRLGRRLLLLLLPRMHRGRVHAAAAAAAAAPPAPRWPRSSWSGEPWRAP